MINVLNRKWNDDSIAAVIDLKLSAQVNKINVMIREASSRCPKQFDWNLP